MEQARSMDGQSPAHLARQNGQAARDEATQTIGSADTRQSIKRRKVFPTPRWAGLVPSIEAPPSMVGLGFVNGWSRVRQWIEQRDSMDGTARLNGWSRPVQWMDNHPPISRGKTDKRNGRTTRSPGGGRPRLPGRSTENAKGVGRCRDGHGTNDSTSIAQDYTCF